MRKFKRNDRNNKIRFPESQVFLEALTCILKSFTDSMSPDFPRSCGFYLYLQKKKMRIGLPTCDQLCSGVSHNNKYIVCIFTFITVVVRIYFFPKYLNAQRSIRCNAHRKKTSMFQKVITYLKVGKYATLLI